MLWIQGGIGKVTLLQVKHLSTWFRLQKTWVHAVDDVTFSVKAGEVFALIGESGCGKSVTALSLMQLLSDNAYHAKSSEVVFAGQDLLTLSEGALRNIRGGKMAMIFQDPMTCLNPVLRVGQQIGESLRLHQGLRGHAAVQETVRLLDLVEMPRASRQVGAYPHELSGGMRQRIMIAMALAGKPDLLIADEPTTALDVITQASILSLLSALKTASGMAILFITHDLTLVEKMADHVAVMQAGHVVEHGAVSTVLRAPEQRYTQRLLAAVPRYVRSGVMSSVALKKSEAAGSNPPLLSVSGLKVYFAKRRGFLRRFDDTVRAVDGIDLTVHAGETLAIVGRSGCGKTTMGQGILSLVKPTAGDVLLHGHSVVNLAGAALKQFRRSCQVVFQDPYSAMNPKMRILSILEEGMLVHGLGGTARKRLYEVDKILEQVGLSPSCKQRFPHEFSGGQRQRVCLARVLLLSPKLLICDEPTSSLDVSVQAEVLKLLKQLQEQLGLAYLFITHNLALVASMAHRVAVMHAGKIVEQGSVEAVLFHARSVHTKALLAAMPHPRHPVA